MTRKIISEKNLRKTIQELLRENLIVEYAEYCPRLKTDIKKAADVYPGLIKSGALNESDTLVLVDGSSQKISIIKDGKIVKQLSCSTSASGFGNANPSEESGPTATGLMKISGVVGSGEPIGTVFEKRVKTGKIVKPNTGNIAYMTTRLILLSGMQNENKNVVSRGIYIHGTNRESRLGAKASHGCVRVSNSDVIWIEQNVPVGSYVYIWGDPIDTNPEFPCTPNTSMKDYLQKKYQDFVNMF